MIDARLSGEASSRRNVPSSRSLWNVWPMWPVRKNANITANAGMNESMRLTGSPDLGRALG